MTRTTTLNTRHMPFEKLPRSSTPGRVPPQMRLMAAFLDHLRHGTLRVDAPDGTSHTFGTGAQPAGMVIHDWSMLAAVLKSGDIGFAESFIAGHWDTDDLPGLLELLARNRDALGSMIYGKWWSVLLYRIKHLLNRNSMSGSRRNIHAHYDIGNAFYALWLDPSMTYSSALFTDHADSLGNAQAAKYERILTQLALPQNARILELGCGWGGFAEFAARKARAHVTGITLSEEQLRYAEQRLVRAGQDRLADLRLQDYRDVNGDYDGIASVEMFEAVGEAYWPAFFDCVSRNLKQGGRACIQTITIAETLFERYRKGTDFIQQYIFPGGMLPSREVFRRHAQRHGLTPVDEFAFGLDYARTLAEWRANFHEQRCRIRALGYDERFMRTWDFYLAYCEAGFRAGSIDVMQFTLEKQ